MAFVTEDALEGVLLQQFAELGYEIGDEDVMGPDGTDSERESYDQTILTKRLSAAARRINPSLPTSAVDDAVKQVTETIFPELLSENRRIQRLLAEGIDVEYVGEDGTVTASRVNLIDYEDPSNNDWLAVNQFTVVGGQHTRRPDVVVFINGLPVGVIELKAPGGETATVDSAYNQLQTYKAQIPALFSTNALLVASDGLTARAGSLSANLERFMPWRTIDGVEICSKGSLELHTLTAGIFDHERLLQIIRDFTVFSESGSGLAKIIAGYHQFHAVNRAVQSTIRSTAPDGDKKVGVIWHTQGSGKSLLMAFYAGQLVRRPEMANPTIVVLTDRNDLDDQLYGTFSMCQDLIRQRPEHADSREDLQRLLNRASGGVVFTTIQKFSPETNEDHYPVLTDRRNVVVIADEAHRSQYGFKSKLDATTGQVSFGFAKYLRDALPNASFIGFTGTPIEADDVNTPAVFGTYIDIYDISRAVEDGATVPIYYESRLARIELDPDELPQIDAAVDEITEDAEKDEQEKLKRKWSAVEVLVGSDKRIDMVAKDLVEHFENRTAAQPGKGMVVCMSRRICVKLHDAIVKLRPEWYSADDMEGAVKIVMTGSASDPLEWQEHIGNKKRRDALAVRARDPDDALKLVIVRDMWLTGFDAPCMHTMYIDKPMRGHGLMQAIARVNRVFREKQGGLVVDYIGVAQNLKSALQDYSAGDRDKTGIDEEQAVGVMMEKYEVVRDMFHGFDYLSALRGTAQERMVMLANAIEWVLDAQQRWAAQEKTEDAKKKAHRRYNDAVLALGKAYSLAGASDQARAIREEVAFFQAIRVALAKSASKSTTSQRDREFAVEQLVSRAVVSTEIVDILAATGLNSPDISVLSEEFLDEIQQSERKNLAIEALRKLLTDGIRSRSKTNVVQTKEFSQRLEESIARYHTNALTTAEMIQKLIELAKDLKAARERGDESGMTDDVIAFYDALALNDSAVEVLGDTKLKVIAHEVLESLKKTVTTDWQHRENARARLRTTVKKILKRYGYPPDLQDEAVKTVLAQAEALASSLTE
jgi:type I restriction enzyme R subunit